MYNWYLHQLLSIIWPKALFQASVKALGSACLGLECCIFAGGSTVSLPHRPLSSLCTITLSVSSSLSSFTEPSLEETFITILLIPSHIIFPFFCFFSPCPHPTPCHGLHYFPLHSSPSYKFSTFLYESLPRFVTVFLCFPGFFSFLPSHLSFISFTLFLFIVLCLIPLGVPLCCSLLFLLTNCPCEKLH